MSVISVSYAVRLSFAVRFTPMYSREGVVCPSISVALFAKRYFLAAFHKISSVARMNPLPVGGFNYRRRNESIPSLFFILFIFSRAVCMRTRAPSNCQKLSHPEVYSLSTLGTRYSLLCYWTAQWFNVDWVSPNMVARLPRATELMKLPYCTVAYTQIHINGLQNSSIYSAYSTVRLFFLIKGLLLSVAFIGHY